LVNAHAHAVVFDYPDEWRAPDLVFRGHSDTALTFALLVKVLHGIANSKENITAQRKRTLKTIDLQFLFVISKYDIFMRCAKSAFKCDRSKSPHEEL
jgi:hypothetical protein